MELSVIIPTFNRAKILAKTLHALFEQKWRQFEIIIVDDGSKDETEKIIQNIEIPKDIKVLYFKQKNKGQGIARNLGVKKASGNITLFIGDDIIATPNLVEEHVKIHKEHLQENIAVLGRIEWHPELEITPFMEWVTNGSSILGKYGGHQFAYEKIKGKKEVDFDFFYTSNISLKTSLLKKEPFDENFQSYGWEDIELGYRLSKEKNLKIYYNESALAYHYHPMSEDMLISKMCQIGASAKIIDKKYPELKKYPSLQKRIIFHMLSNPISLMMLNTMKKIFQNKTLGAYYYYALSKKYFLQGLKKT
jgi:glycosyltransferase involved in cell wall biosynthesis